MLLKLFIPLLIILSLAFTAVAQDTKQTLNDQLWEAARKGDAAVVKALLDKGADVNAKFRYGATALSYAADKGHFEVVKILLERGADVNVRDTFYNATPLQWATEKSHTAIVKALLDKGAEGVDEVLLAGARNGNVEFVRMALAKGGLKPETLTAALVASTADEKKAEIAEMLKKAGAQPPPEIAVETLQSYVGKYKGEQGSEVAVTFTDGKLYVTQPGQGPLLLSAIDKTTFKPTAFDGVIIVFNVEGSKTTGFTLKQGPNTSVLKKVE
ncbi:MAG TPA: ankyrin repeat domain-containing protein [Pyrinomonadaceae bacterium]